MATLYYPDAKRLGRLGFDSVAGVPALFDRAGRYCRTHNRYLRERALGEAGLGRPAPWDAEKVPSEKTVENIARHLGVFVDWCDHRKIDWRDVSYKSVLRFQNDMALGRWSLSGRTLKPRTANHHADESTAFLAWAADRGLRPAFDVKYKVVSRPSGAQLPGQATALVRSRQGRRPESDSEDVEKVSYLPKPQQVASWLQAVRQKKGYPKYLASRFVLESGTRLFETVAIKEHQIPSKETLQNLSLAGQVSGPVTLVVTKGGRPRTISIAIPFLMEIRNWLDGGWLRLRYLWHKRENSPPKSLVFLSDARHYEGTPVSEARLYDCFHTVEPRPARWTTHFGRHTYACFYVLYALEHEATAAGRALSDMGADWVVARGAWYLKTLRKQLGHVSEETTDLYLRWLVTASGLAEAAAGWHTFLLL
ncbi:site-specific integrase [Aminobacter carboxidus]|uniref:Site-specific integrase n=1 Tax=Aminobacter carboxidus TaxID=376165 RepID=A0ABR9GJ32_9HYPH|nr:site-specific integrase [Aminobacter carboxidus]MBE1203686.1 site-specific integrase [Aminobacter carboxidus]